MPPLAVHPLWTLTQSLRYSTDRASARRSNSYGRAAFATSTKLSGVGQTETAVCVLTRTRANRCSQRLLASGQQQPIKTQNQRRHEAGTKWTRPSSRILSLIWPSTTPCLPSGAFSVFFSLFAPPTASCLPTPPILLCSSSAHRPTAAAACD